MHACSRLDFVPYQVPYHIHAPSFVHAPCAPRNLISYTSQRYSGLDSESLIPVLQPPALLYESLYHKPTKSTLLPPSNRLQRPIHAKRRLSRHPTQQPCSATSATPWLSIIPYHTVPSTIPYHTIRTTTYTTASSTDRLARVWASCDGRGVSPDPANLRAGETSLTSRMPAQVGHTLFSSILKAPCSRLDLLLQMSRAVILWQCDRVER